MKKSFYLPGLLAACSILFSVTAMATVPTITTNPSNDTVCAGVTAKFFIAANDTPDTSPIIVAWQVSTDGGTTWATVTDTTAGYSGTTTDTLSYATADSVNGYLYRSITTDTSGADTSSWAMLTINDPAAAITGTSAICSGSSVTLSDAVSGGIWSRIYPSIDTITSAGVLTGLSSGFDTITYTLNNACGTTIATLPVRVDVPVSAAPISGPGTTCVGHTIDLTNPNTAGTWAWSVSNGSASITHEGSLTGLSQGMDTVSYIFTNACVIDTSTFLVEVDTLLNPGVISGPIGVCSGSWIHLSETVIGGVWISSSPVAVVDGSGDVTGVSVGATTISYYLSNGCGASVATQAVTVSIEASSIAGIDSVGIGTTRALSDAAPGGTWSISDTIATIDSTGLVTGVAAGTVTVTYTVTNGCGTTSATLLLHIDTAVVSPIAGLASVCQGGATITLSDATAGGTWSSSNDTFATVNPSTGVVTGVATGTVTISYTYTYGFGTAVATKTIFVDHAPVISLTGPNLVSIGGNYNFRATPPDGIFSVSNSSVGQFIAFSDSLYAGVAYATFGSFIMLKAGTDVIHYSFTNECGTADSLDTVSIAIPSKVNTIVNGTSGLNVYPNPSEGAFSFTLVTNTTEQASIIITNVAGEKVKEFTALTNQANDLKLDESAGIYFMSASTSNGSYTAKITIAK